jgi:hypothetical protein
MDHRFNLRLHYGGGRTEDRLVYHPTIWLWGVAQWTSDVRFNNSPQCFGSAHSGGSGVFATCTDSTIHSIAVDVTSAPLTTMYVDCVAGTTSSASVYYDNGNLGVGAAVVAYLIALVVSARSHCLTTSTTRATLPAWVLRG